MTFVTILPESSLHLDLVMWTTVWRAMFTKLINWLQWDQATQVFAREALAKSGMIGRIVPSLVGEYQVMWNTLPIYHSSRRLHAYSGINGSYSFSVHCALLSFPVYIWCSRGSLCWGGEATLLRTHCFYMTDASSVNVKIVFGLHQHGWCSGSRCDGWIS